MMEINVPVPDGKSGDWEVSTFSVTEKDIELHNLRCMFSAGMGNRTMYPGTYKKLTRNGYLVMSNTVAEIDDHRYFIHKAKGDVLINGLGLGVCVFGILEANKKKKEKVASITIIEKSQDVINLVRPYLPHYADEVLGVAVVQADAFEFKPPKGKKYGAVWHDIFDDICADNLPEMTKLKRKYGRRTEWQGCWCEALCRLHR